MSTRGEMGKEVIGKMTRTSDIYGNEKNLTNINYEELPPPPITAFGPQLEVLNDWLLVLHSGISPGEHRGHTGSWGLNLDWLCAKQTSYLLYTGPSTHFSFNRSLNYQCWLRKHSHGHTGFRSLNLDIQCVKFFFKAFNSLH